MVERAGREEFLKTARDRFTRSAEASTQWRKEAASAMKFLTGDQWPERNKAMRTQDGRPCLTVNRLSQLVRLVANEIAKSKPGMMIHPVDSDSDLDTAQILLGIIRHIEKVKDASVAYGTATDNQVRCGLGYFGFKTRYSRRDSFEQEICLRFYPNPLAVYRDPSSTEFDGSDSMFYFVIEKMSRELYRERWPDSEANNEGFHGYLDGYDEWYSKDEVQVAEYWHVTKTTRKLVKLKESGAILWKDELEYKEKEINAMISQEREVEHRAVKRAIINGHEVLEEDEWPGPWIPIFPVFGEVVYVDGKPKIRGLIEDAKEPQRVLNYMFSGAMEMVALAPKAPWIAARDQIAKNKKAWRESNTKAHAVLEYDPVVSTTEGGAVMVPPPQRNTYEPPIQALIAGLTLAEDGIRHAVGLHAPSIGALSKERSGRAITRLQQQGSLATYHFVLNFARSIRFAIQQLVGDGENQGLIQTIYNEPGRIMRIIGEDDVEKMFVIGKNEEDLPDKTLKEKSDFSGVYDIGAGLYDVVADVGQAFSTQRQEAFAAISQIFQSAPDLMKLFGDIWLKNADFPGAREMADRAKKILPPNLRGEEPEVPSEVQEQIQKMQAQMQAMAQELEKRERIIQTKQIESASNERIKAQDRESRERVEAIKAELEAAKILSDTVNKLEERQSKESIEKLKARLSLIQQSIVELREDEGESLALADSQNSPP